MDNPCANVKNSLPRDRNTEQSHILKMNFVFEYRMRLSGYINKLFGITGPMDLRQFHFRTEITHPLSGLSFCRFKSEVTSVSGLGFDSGLS